MSELLASRADLILQHAMEALAARRLPHYERVGREAAAGRLGALLQLVVDGARTRDLVPIIEHAERIGRERFDSGFEFLEVQSAFNLLEEAIWRAVLAEAPKEELGEALGVVSTLLGAAKDRLASTYVSLASGRHVPSLDLSSLFSGTQNTGGGAET